MQCPKRGARFQSVFFVFFFVVVVVVVVDGVVVALLLQVRVELCTSYS